MIDLLDPDVVADPYPHYRRLREDSPAAYVEEDDMWLVSRYEDVQSVMRDTETFSSKLGMGNLMSGRISPRLDGWTAESMFEDSDFRLLIAADPPDHTQLRRLVSKPFSPRRIAESMTGGVQQLADQVVEDLLDAGDEADLVRQVAYPLPVLVIAEVLGIPGSERERFKRWSDALVGALGGGLLNEEAMAASAEMTGYFNDIIRARRENPGTDLISDLVQSELRDGTRLTGGELTFLCVLLLIAGNETTTNLIGNGTWALLQNPEEAHKLAADPSLISSAVEEMLRFDSPVQMLFRQTTTDTSIAGTPIPEGARVLPIFASANRDDRQYPEGDALRVDRNPTDHIAFGYGIHFCLGAALARLEARLVAETGLKRIRSMELRAEPERLATFLLRGFRTMPVTVRAR